MGFCFVCTLNFFFFLIWDKGGEQVEETIWTKVATNLSFPPGCLGKITHGNAFP